MKVRTYMTHLLRVNFDELTQLPPYEIHHRHKSLGMDELMDIMLHGTPKAWEVEMDRQSFDPLLHTLPEVVNFMESLELSMSTDADTKREDYQDLVARGIRSKTSDPNKIPKGMLYCRHHGYGKHSSEKCYKLKAQAKRQKTQQPVRAPATRQVVQLQTDNLNVAAYVQQQIKEGVRQELASMNRKRRAAPFSRSSRAGASELLAFDLTVEEDTTNHGLDSLENSLEGFNYEEMDNLPVNHQDPV